MNTKCLHIIASGRVQGVGFRHYTKIEADKYELHGTVMNMQDGTVEIYAQGEEVQLIPFLEWCHDGPNSSEVESLSYTYIDSKSYSGFMIIR